jgi:hypothetical protein
MALYGYALTISTPYRHRTTSVVSPSRAVVETLADDNLNLTLVKTRLLDHEIKINENRDTALKVLQTVKVVDQSVTTRCSHACLALTAYCQRASNVDRASFVNRYSKIRGPHGVHDAVRRGGAGWVPSGSNEL